MVDKITIKFISSFLRETKQTFETFSFVCTSKEKDRIYNLSETKIFCWRCGFYLTYVYANIIHQLEEQNLLPDDFEPLCCGCYKAMKGV